MSHIYIYKYVHIEYAYIYIHTRSHSFFREASVDVNDKAVMSLQTVSLFLSETRQKKKNKQTQTVHWDRVTIKSPLKPVSNTRQIKYPRVSHR